VQLHHDLVGEHGDLRAVHQPDEPLDRVGDRARDVDRVRVAARGARLERERSDLGQRDLVVDYELTLAVKDRRDHAKPSSMSCARRVGPASTLGASIRAPRPASHPPGGRSTDHHRRQIVSSR
jgi:hypothetical protein